MHVNYPWTLSTCISINQFVPPQTSVIRMHKNTQKLQMNLNNISKCAAWTCAFRTSEASTRLRRATNNIFPFSLCLGPALHSLLGGHRSGFGNKFERRASSERECASRPSFCPLINIFVDECSCIHFQIVWCSVEIRHFDLCTECFHRKERSGRKKNKFSGNSECFPFKFKFRSFRRFSFYSACVVSLTFAFFPRPLRQRRGCNVVNSHFCVRPVSLRCETLLSGCNVNCRRQRHQDSGRAECTVGIGRRPDEEKASVKIWKLRDKARESGSGRCAEADATVSTLRAKSRTGASHSFSAPIDSRIC